MTELIEITKRLINSYTKKEREKDQTIFSVFICEKLARIDYEYWGSTIDEYKRQMEKFANEKNRDVKFGMLRDEDTKEYKHVGGSAWWPRLEIDKRLRFLRAFLKCLQRQQNKIESYNDEQLKR